MEAEESQGEEIMAVETRTMSLTRPTEPAKEGARNPWQFGVGLTVAVAGVVSLTVLFVISAVVAGWVSDITDASEANPANLLARTRTYMAWLSPVAMASVAVTMVGIAAILLGIVRRLWIQVAFMYQGLLALKRGGTTS